MTVKKNPKGRFSVVIPVYNHEEMVAGVVRKAQKLSFPVFVVDDGSTDSTYDNIRKIKGISILRHPVNMGKGAAIMTGLKEAAKVSDWAITIDADGQHDPSDAQKLIDAIPSGERPVVIGTRGEMLEDDVPWTSRFGRGFSNFWVRLSGGPAVRDSQSGFRIYPLPEAAELDIKATRYQFEVEILAKANWKKMRFASAPISVTYTPGTKRISHFRPFVDFMRNAKVFARLIAQRIFIPAFIRSRR